MDGVKVNRFGFIVVPFKSPLSHHSSSGVFRALFLSVVKCGHITDNRLITTHHTYTMAKFVPPPSIKKVKELPESHATGKIWPIGTLWYHEASDTYFRFLGGVSRSGASYRISTHKGIFAGTGYGPNLKYNFSSPVVGYPVDYSDKNALVNRLIEALTNVPI